MADESLAQSESSTLTEFAVQMNCQGCAESIKKTLDQAEGIQSYQINLQNEQVIIESSLPSVRLQELLESTGKKTVLRGQGTDSQRKHLGAAVAIFEGFGAVQGLLRFLQISKDKCVVDGTLDGLTAGPHALHINEFGDISQGCASTGDHFNPYNQPHGSPLDEQRHVGDLGNIVADSNGRAVFRFEDPKVKVWDVIGRSVVVDSGEDDLGRGSHPFSKLTGNSGEGLSCGIIARSAGLFENTKTFCACDGKTLWEEKQVTGTHPSSQL